MQHLVVLATSKTSVKSNISVGHSGHIICSPLEDISPFDDGLTERLLRYIAFMLYLFVVQIYLNHLQVEMPGRRRRNAIDQHISVG